MCRDGPPYLTHFVEISSILFVFISADMSGISVNEASVNSQRHFLLAELNNVSYAMD